MAWRTLPEPAQGLQIRCDSDLIRAYLAHHFVLPAYWLEGKVRQKLAIEDAPSERSR